MCSDAIDRRATGEWEAREYEYTYNGHDDQGLGTKEEVGVRG
jgi:hypothetical protein